MACVSVIALAPAFTVSGPVSVSTVAAVCVTAPVAVRFALVTLSAPRFVAAALVVSAPALPLTFSD